MSDILTLARAHYGRMRNQKIEIPEWSGEDGAPAVIHFSPLTLRQRQKLNARAGADNPARVMALAVILFALDAEGKPLFEGQRHDPRGARVGRRAGRDRADRRRDARRDRRRELGKLIAGDEETRNLYALALALHKSLGEILDLPAEEIRGWMAYLSRKD